MPRATRTVSAVCTAVVATLVLATPAFAHSDQGAMAAESRPAGESMAVTTRARIVFADDGHPANEATVTVTGSGPGGAQAGPAVLNRVDEGEYEAMVLVPVEGDWSFELTSTNPTATAATTSTVTAPPAQAPLTRQPNGGNPDSDDDSSGLDASVFAIAGGAAVLAAVAGGVLAVRRRR